MRARFKPVVADKFCSSQGFPLPIKAGDEGRDCEKLDVSHNSDADPQPFDRQRGLEGQVRGQRKTDPPEREYIKRGCEQLPTTATHNACTKEALNLRYPDLVCTPLVPIQQPSIIQFSSPPCYGVR